MQIDVLYELKCIDSCISEFTLKILKLLLSQFQADASVIGNPKINRIRRPRMRKSILGRNRVKLIYTITQI